MQKSASLIAVNEKPLKHKFKLAWKEQEKFPSQRKSPLKYSASVVALASSNSNASSKLSVPGSSER